MRNILVTGAGGFIGSHLMQYLGKHFLYGFYHNPLSAEELFLKKGIVLVGDITNYLEMKRIIVEYEITHVFHLAAQPLVSLAEKSPISTLQTNIIGTTVLLELCRELKFCLIHQSTDKVLGNAEKADLTNLYNPVDLYGISKTTAEQLCNFYKQNYFLDIRIIRPCNIFGFDKNLNRLFPDLITSCLKGINPQIKKPSLFAGKKEFMKRQFIYVKNFVKIITEIAFLDQPLKNHIFHVAANNILTTEEVATKILAHFPALKLEYKDSQNDPIEIMEQSLDPLSCYRSHSSHTLLDDAIKETIDEYRQWLKI